MSENAQLRKVLIDLLFMVEHRLAIPPAVLATDHAIIAARAALERSE